MTRPGAIHRIAILVMTFAILPGCATTPHHQFAALGNDSRTRTGQLQYHNAKTTLIGDVIVRLTGKNDVELTFSKGPGVTLLTIRQDGAFAEVRGAMAGPGWSGPIDKAPHQLRGWLGLGDKIIRAPNQTMIRHQSGQENFVIRF